MVIRVLRFFTLVLLLCISGPAFAQDLQRAKDEYKEGYRELQKKHYKAALGHYQLSYDNSPRPRTLYNIALCHEGMGDNKEALAKYQQFIETAEARDAAFLADAREKLKALLKRVGAHLEVTSDPSGAAVIIDGTIRGHTPLRTHLLAGKHLVRVRRRGVRTSSRSIDIQPGENLEESFQLDEVGHLKLQATPRDALIRRKGVDDVGTGTYKAELSPGPYEFEVSLAGYRTRVVKFTVRENENIDKSIRLKALSDTGEIHIRSDVRDAGVSIDGLIVGSTRDSGNGPNIERRLMAGHHVIIVESRDHQPWRKRVHISPGETLSVDLKFRQSSGRAAASLTLTTLGTVTAIAGVTLGVLAISDMRSDSESSNTRGQGRATNAALLLGAGAAGLIGGYYVKGGAPKATLARSHE